MNNQIQGLLAQANPQLGRMLDQQARDKAQQERMKGTNYGNDAMGRFLTAASGAARTAAEGGRDFTNRLTGNTPGMGVNERAAVEAQQQQQVMVDAIKGAEGATQSERLLNAAEKLENSGNPQAVMKAMQLREKASSLSLQEKQLDLSQQRLEVQRTANELAKSPKVTSTENIYDSKGNLFKEIVYKDGKREVMPVGNSPEKPIGAVSTSQEVNSNNILNRQINVANNKQYLKDRNAAAADFQAASKGFASASKVLELVEKAKDDTGGYVNVKIAEAKKLLGFNAEDDIPVQELDKALKADMLANLKATFGGSQITDSERNFLERTMPSLMDSPELIKRKAEANRAMQKRILDRTKALSETKNYTQYIEVETKHFQSDYDRMMEEYSEFTGSGTGGDRGELTQDQILVRDEINNRLAQKKQNERRNRRGSGA